MRFSDRADWWPTIDAAQCSGTPARSHWVTNHLRREWNTTPGQLTPALTRSLANGLVTMLTLSPGNSLPVAGNRASIAVSPECNGKKPLRRVGFQLPHAVRALASFFWGLCPKVDSFADLVSVRLGLMG